MARSKSEFLSSLGTAFQIFKAISDQVLNLGGKDEDLRRVLSDQILAEKIARLFIERNSEVFPVTVDYSQSLAQMIVAGKYNWVNPDITQEHFPITASGTVELLPELVHFGKSMSTDDVLKELDRRGFRPTTLPELLAFGTKFPEKQREFPVVSLGSVWADSRGDRRVPVLDGYPSERGLDLYWVGRDWHVDCRFLVARK